jgi:hypothetical protein
VWRPVEPAAYCYLLGCYLGDGHITFKAPGAWTLRISCDPEYPRILEEIQTAMRTVFADRLPRAFSPTGSAVRVISVSHPSVRDAFPQHGPGKKHERAIVLEAWQDRLSARHPEALIRGLIHSDGCRVTNTVRTTLPSGRAAEYRYTRYFFSNLSADIRQIFRRHCALLGVHVTQSNPRNLSVSRRTSVEILDRHVGPKL